jgi:hypothetical protein
MSALASLIVFSSPACAEDRRAGIQAVLLCRWSVASCNSLTAVLSDTETVDHLEIAFAIDYHKSGDIYTNPRAIVSNLLAANPNKTCAVTVHLGVIHQTSFPKAALAREVRTLWKKFMKPVFDDPNCGALGASRVTFYICPSLEDQASADKVKAACLVVAKALPLDALPYLNTDPKKIRLRRSPSDNAFSFGSSLAFKRKLGPNVEQRYTMDVTYEFHGCQDAARSGHVYSNDGAIVYTSREDPSRIQNIAETTVPACKGKDSDFTVEEFKALRDNYPSVLLWRHPYNLYHQVAIPGSSKIRFQTKEEAHGGNTRNDSESMPAFNASEAATLKKFLKK